MLNAHPAVSQSVVVGRALADGNEEVVAFVELAAGSTTTVRRACGPCGRRSSRRTSGPSEIHVLQALPASATGKVLRGQLKSRAQEADPSRRSG